MSVVVASVLSSLSLNGDLEKDVSTSSSSAVLSSSSGLLAVLSFSLHSYITQFRNFIENQRVIVNKELLNEDVCVFY
jgi:hypothetical protein